MVRDIGVVVTVSQLWIASARIKGNPDRTSIASIRLEEERDRCLGFVPNFVIGMLGGTTPIAVVLGVYDGGRQRSGVSRNDVNSTSLRGGLLWGGFSSPDAIPLNITESTSSSKLGPIFTQVEERGRSPSKRPTGSSSASPPAPEDAMASLKAMLVHHQLQHQNR